jgi:ribonuclease BN (tRNA processing enzyme)
MLVDCGSAVLAKMQKYIKIEELDALLVSHYHFDHTADIGTLLYGRQIKTKLGQVSKPLDIYGHTYNRVELDRMKLEGYANVTAYTEKDTIQAGPFTITFCEVKHPVKCYAMRISDGQDTVAYTGDTSYFTGLSKFVRGAQHLICECNLYSNQEGAIMGHMNSADAARVANDAEAYELLLTHLPHYGDIGELKNDAEKTFKGRISLAHTGWVWER